MEEELLETMVSCRLKYYQLRHYQMERDGHVTYHVRNVDDGIILMLGQVSYKNFNNITELHKHVMLNLIGPLIVIDDLGDIIIAKEGFDVFG